MTALFSQAQMRRFWSKVQKTERCWLWMGSRTSRGYGNVHWRHFTPATVAAHQVSYAMAHGEWPPAGLVLRHMCNTPQCVRPSHLRIGTYQENSEDMLRAGRQRRCGPWHAADPKVLTDTEVALIRRRYARTQATIATLAREFGVSGSTVSRVVRGLRWSGVAKHRQYIPGRRGARFGSRNVRAKLTWEQITAIRQQYQAGGVTYLALAGAYGVSKSVIGGIVRGENWTRREPSECEVTTC